METYKDIKGFEGLYQVSNLGNVKSLEKSHKSGFMGRGITVRPEKIRKLSKDKDGYMCVSLSLNGKVFSKKVHRLVAEAFIPNPSKKHEVNHKNLLKNDNRVDNLEWCSRSENQKHAYKLGALKSSFNKEVSRANGLKKSKKVFAYDFKTNEFLWEEYSINEACRKHSLDKRSVQRVLKGEKRYVKNIVLSFTKI